MKILVVAQSHSRTRDSHTVCFDFLLGFVDEVAGEDTVHRAGGYHNSSEDVLGTVNVASVAEIFRSWFVCQEGSREISEKADALVRIWMEWPIDTNTVMGGFQGTLEPGTNDLHCI